SLFADARSTQAAANRSPPTTSTFVPPSTTRFLLWLAATRIDPSLAAWHRARDPAHPNTRPLANHLCGPEKGRRRRHRGRGSIRSQPGHLGSQIRAAYRSRRRPDTRAFLEVAQSSRIQRGKDRAQGPLIDVSTNAHHNAVRPYHLDEAVRPYNSRLRLLTCAVVSFLDRR